MHINRITFAALLLMPLARLQADEFSAQREQVLTLGKLTNAPAMHMADGFASTADLKAIYYDALDWKGSPTKVFAWLGLPENRSGKVPGIVLVHGGGGTAYKAWVTNWTARGFAAISIAVEGQTDVLVSAPNNWQQTAWPGPKRIGIYADSSEPLAEQWMYHAVADTVLANSLLRSLPEVDADKVGVMGVSWGGVITSTAMGIDDRFAFAIPTYGCGHLFDSDNQYGRALGNNHLYKQVWDPMVRMSRAKMPALWLSWPTDKHFPLDCQAATYQAASGPHMVSLIPGMNHSHPSAWNPPDSYAFAESIVRDGQPWCRQISSQISQGVVRVEFYSARTLDRPVLVSTTNTGFTGSRKWVESPAMIEQNGSVWSVTATNPAGTTAWFVNVHNGKLTVSSDYQTTK